MKAIQTMTNHHAAVLLAALLTFGALVAHTVNTATGPVALPHLIRTY